MKKIEKTNYIIKSKTIKIKCRQYKKPFAFVLILGKMLSEV